MPDRGRRRTGVVGAIGALALILGVTALSACSGKAASTATTSTTGPAETTTTTEAPLSAGKQFSIYLPTVGHCFDVRTTDKGPTVYLDLDCALPHQNEVFATVDVPGKDWPGAPALESFAKNTCPASWEAYVGKPYATSSYEIGYLLPQESAWGNGVHHVIGCLVVPSGAPRTAGSARGTAQ
jgi:hypothetical protein